MIGNVMSELMRVDTAFSNKIGVGAFLCALEIAAFHAPGEWAELTPQAMWIYRLVSPLTQAALAFFFAVSGFFLWGRVSGSRAYLQVVIKRTRTLLVPFFLWNLIFLCSVLVMIHGLRGTDALPGFMSLMPSGGARWLSFETMSFVRNCPNPILWFLRTLFVLVVISPVLVLGIRWLKIFLPLVLGVGCLVVETVHISIPFTALMQPRAVFYFTLGLWWGMCCAHGRKWDFGVLGCAALLCIGYALALFTPAGHLPLMVGFVGVLPALTCGRAMQSYSFPLYMMHYPMVWLFLFLNAKFGLVKTGSAAWVISTGTFALASSLFAILILRRLCPRICGILFGGR